MTRFALKFGCDYGYGAIMSTQIPRSIHATDNHVIIRDERGQEIAFDRHEFGRIVSEAFKSGFVQIVGVDIDIRHVDIMRSRRV